MSASHLKTALESGRFWGVKPVNVVELGAVFPAEGGLS